jgi:hypothetical protein
MRPTDRLGAARRGSARLVPPPRGSSAGSARLVSARATAGRAGGASSGQICMGGRLGRDLSLGEAQMSRGVPGLSVIADRPSLRTRRIGLVCVLSVPGCQSGQKARAATGTATATATAATATATAAAAGGRIWRAPERGCSVGAGGCPPRIRTSPNGSKVRCPTTRPGGSRCRTGPAARSLRRRGQKNGAEDGTRTRDPHLGKVMLYQLSHFRSDVAPPGR